jgi:plastocyanin
MKRLLTFAALCACAAAPAVAEDWGTVSGQIVVTGTIPKPELLHKAGAPVKDAEVCAVVDTYKQDLIIDDATKGLANVIVYMPKAPKSIHPDLKESKPASIVFDQKGCVFIPHAMIVRVGQTVEVISSDAVSHNTHTYPLKNQSINVLIPPNTPVGKGEKAEFRTQETLPMQVKCDFHPWMIAYWMVVDHPYAAVTDKEGKFTIPNLPVGEHEFRVWHERPGYLERKFSVVVKPGDNALAPMKVDAAKLKAK